MPLPTTYSTGTASVANGATTVTLVGAVSGAIYAGDLFMDPAQPLVPPQRIATDPVAGVFDLAVAWPGTSMTSDPYEVRITPDSARVQERTRQVLERLGTLTALGIQPDAFGVGADRDVYDDEAAGFIFLDLGTPWTLYAKLSPTSGDWDTGQTVEGATGPAGANVVWLVGSGAPSGGTGSDGDMYLRDNGDVYGPKAAGSWGSIVANIKGATGATGATGAAGSNGTNGTNGVDGADPGVLLNFDTSTTDADPGAGDLRANNASLASATLLYVSKTARGGSSIATFLATLDDSTNTIKGQLVITDPASDAQAVFNVTSLTDATGYVKVGVASHSGATAFANALPISFQFARAGDKGADGLGAGDVIGPASAVNNSLVAFDGTTGKLVKDGGVVVDTDTSLAANSDARLATQKATKAYVDAVVAAQDAMVFKGVVDCSANPNYPAADRGWTYRVSVAGKIGGASGLNVEAGDILLCLTDATSSGNQATVGSSWTVVQTNLDGAVIGPSSVTDGNPVLFDGTTGKLIKQSTFAAFKTALSLAQADISGLTTASSPQFTGIEVGHATDTTITRTAAGRLSVEGNPILLGSTEQQTLSGGANVTVKSLGNLSGTSITPNPGDRPIQKVTNNGAGSILPGTNEGQYTLQVINASGAGAITTTGWTIKGDSFDTTTTSKFLCSCIVTSDVKLMTVIKVA